MDCYEVQDPLLSRRAFVRRFARHLALALIVIGGSLAVGMAGYMSLGGLSAVDAFLNVAMFLGGMGPVNILPNDAAKIFAGVFALYAGMAFWSLPRSSRRPWSTASTG